jgi:hypothetical protein
MRTTALIPLAALATLANVADVHAQMPRGAAPPPLAPAAAPAPVPMRPAPASVAPATPTTHPAAPVAPAPVAPAAPAPANGAPSNVAVHNTGVQFAGARPHLVGWVDLHAHPMSYLGFGRKAIAGGVDVGSLLPVDSQCHRDVVATSWEQALGNDNAVHGGYGAFDNTCGDVFRNQVIGSLEDANHALHPPEGGHGAPEFGNWPAWNDITHQKMYVDWIERAWQGGERVMVALAVNNKTLGDGIAGPGDGPTDDKTSADLQTQKMKEFIGRHSNFMQIAYSANDLEQIVNSGKLAIVLGMEVDNIGNFNTVGNLNEATVRNEIQRLWDEGIRYIFPIHVIDNKFGGTAVYEGGFNTSNYREAGHFWNLTCAAPGEGITYQYKPAGFDLMMSVGLEVKLGIDGFRQPPTPPNCTSTGHKNSLGLTPLGEFAIREMMHHGMMIDIDHMSQFSADRALTLAEAVQGGGYPLMSGHNGIRGWERAIDENKRTSTQLHRIAALHGMFGLGDGGLDAYTWMRLYAKAVQETIIPGPVPNLGVVAMGTDLNGMVVGARPRAGSNVTYSPFFPVSRLGARTWDYNREGVAHYGMLSDFLQDARTAPDGATLVETQLKQSANYFRDTWVKCEAQAPNVR